MLSVGIPPLSNHVYLVHFGSSSMSLPSHVFPATVGVSISLKDDLFSHTLCTVYPLPHTLSVTYVLQLIPQFERYLNGYLDTDQRISTS